MRKFYHKLPFLLMVLCAKIFFAQAYTQNFDDITTLTSNGWFQKYNSSPVGVNPTWFQGTPITGTPTPGPFNAYSGAANSYIAANFNGVSGGNGTISNWLVTPNRTLRNGDVFTFYTRKPTVGVGQTDYSDRLEVRMSTNGASTNVGTTATAVGDFTTLLLSINPTLVPNVYPQVWTKYTVTISGLPAPTSGRLAFRYFVTAAGPNGTNSDYIGIDTVAYTPYICPAFTMTAGGALTGGVAGNTYSTTLTQTGALGTPNFAITAGALPPGLTLAASGTISGTPTATGTFNFTATASDKSGCTGSQSYSITVACGANPIVFIDLPVLCTNSSLYTLSEALPAGGTYSGTGVTNGQFDPAAGTQTITYDYTDAYGCAYSLAKVINVNAAPTFTNQPDASAICVGGDATFSVVANTSVIYQWQVDTGSGFNNIPAGLPYTGINSSTLNITAATAEMNGYKFRVLILADAGCAYVASDEVLLTVNAAPSITADPIDTTVCAGMNATFSVTADHATGYRWEVNQGAGFNTISDGGVYSGATTATLIITNATAAMNGYIYRAVATGICTPGVNSANAALVVSAVSGTTSVTNVSCNSGSNGTIILTPSGGTAPYTYNWGGGIVTKDRTGLTPGIYAVVIIDSKGCSGAVSVVITQPSSLVAFAASQTNSCFGASNGSATVNATGGTGNYTYSWNTVPQQTGATATGLAPGDYMVTVTDSNSCSAIQSFTIIENAVVSAPTGDATQSFNAGDTLSALVATGENIKWYASENDATNHTNVLPTNTIIVNNTTYYATQTVGMCESTASLPVRAWNPTLGVSNANGKINIQVYPNPVKEMLHFSGNDKILKVVIVSLDGKKVTEKTMNDERKLNVQSLIQGTYLINIVTDKGLQTLKFIKN